MSIDEEIAAGNPLANPELERAKGNEIWRTVDGRESDWEWILLVVAFFLCIPLLGSLLFLIIIVYPFVLSCLALVVHLCGVDLSSPFRWSFAVLAGLGLLLPFTWMNWSDQASPVLAFCLILFSVALVLLGIGLLASVIEARGCRFNRASRRMGWFAAIVGTPLWIVTMAGLLPIDTRMLLDPSLWGICTIPCAAFGVLWGAREDRTTIRFSVRSLALICVVVAALCGLARWRTRTSFNYSIEMATLAENGREERRRATERLRADPEQALPVLVHQVEYSERRRWSLWAIVMLCGGDPGQEISPEVVGCVKQVLLAYADHPQALRAAINKQAKTEPHFRPLVDFLPAEESADSRQALDQETLEFIRQPWNSYSRGRFRQ